MICPIYIIGMLIASGLTLTTAITVRFTIYSICSFTVITFGTIVGSVISTGGHDEITIVNRKESAGAMKWPILNFKMKWDFNVTEYQHDLLHVGILHRPSVCTLSTRKLSVHKIKYSSCFRYSFSFFFLSVFFSHFTLIGAWHSYPGFWNVILLNWREFQQKYMSTREAGDITSELFCGRIISKFQVSFEACWI